MDFFLSTSFDWLLAAVFAVMAVLLFLNKADFLLQSRQKGQTVQQQIYDPKKFRLTMAWICTVLAIAECLTALLRERFAWVSFASIIVVVLAFAVGIIYLNKCARIDKK